MQQVGFFDAFRTAGAGDFGAASCSAAGASGDGFKADKSATAGIEVFRTAGAKSFGAADSATGQGAGSAGVHEQVAAILGRRPA